MRSSLPYHQWIVWVAGLLAASLSGATFVFGYFETKQDAKDKKQNIEQRLERIENKVDFIIQQHVKQNG
jgi:hypothetical protein